MFTSCTCDDVTPLFLFQLALFHSVQVNITILDINDNAPVWRDEPYHANVVEMSPINTDVISVSALSLVWFFKRLYLNNNSTGTQWVTVFFFNYS